MPLSMTPGDKANEIYTNILQNLNSAETNKLAGLTKADTKYAAGDTVLTTPKKRKLKSSLSKKIAILIGAQVCLQKYSKSLRFFNGWC